jgi:hypothetical protein
VCLGGCRIILGTKVSKKLLTDTQLLRFTHALHEVFACSHSKKHMIQRQLGRLEPTPYLKYRAEEVMRNVAALST